MDRQDHHRRQHPPGTARPARMEAQRLRVRLQLRQLLLRNLLPALPRLHQRQQGGLVGVPPPFPDVPLPLPVDVPAEGQGQEPPRHHRRQLRRGLLRRLPLHPLRQLPGEIRQILDVRLSTVRQMKFLLWKHLQK